MTLSPVRKLRRFAVLCLFALGSLSLFPPIIFAETTQHVLVLHSYHQGFRWTDEIGQGIMQTLSQRPGVELHFEYMDSKRLETAEMQQRLLDLYRAKYRDRHFAVILSSDDSAFNFLLQHRRELFGDTPWVFCGTNYLDPLRLPGETNVTGVNETADLRRNLQLALELFPATRRVYLIYDQSVTGERIANYLSHILPEFDPGIEFLPLDQLSMAEIEETLQQAPADSLTLYTIHSRDRLGDFYEFDVSIARVVRASQRPVFITWDFSLGSGAVGGYLTSGEAQGHAVAQMAERILAGESAAHIPPQMESPASYQFDYAALQRFGIPLERLPAGSIVHGAPASTYPIDKRLLATLVSLFLGAVAFAVAVTLALLWRRRAQLLLAESENRFRTMIDHLPAGAIYIDGGDFSFNRGVERIIGYQRGDFAGLDDWFAKLYGERAGEMRQLWEKEKALGFPRVMRSLPVQRRDGEIRFCDFGSWHDREQERSVVLMYDTTERKLTEDALRDSELRHRILAESIPQNVFVKNRDLVYTFCNHRYADLLHLSPEQVIGKTDFDFYPRELAEKYRNDDLRVMVSGQLEEADDEFRVAGGRRTVHSIKAPLHDGRGNVVGVIGLFRDVTDKRAAEERLRQALAEASEARDNIRTIIQTVSDGLIVIDQNHRVQFINEAAQDQLHGYYHPERGARLDELLAPCELRDYFHSIFIRPMENHPQDITLPAREGARPRVFQAKTSYLRNEAGLRTGAVTLLREVTSDRELNRMKNEFIATTAHELRTPLTAIMGFAELLLQESFDPEQQSDLLSEIYSNSDALSRLVSELLDISRIESGRPVPLKRKAGSLRGVLAKAVHQQELTHPDHHFQLELLAQDPADVYTDPDKIMQVLQNLLSNAVKYSPPGSHIRVAETVSGRDYVITVEDDGIGMTREQVERIFDPFYRAEATEATVSGLGLGMSIIKSIVLAHGGEVKVESSYGQGTCVRVTLPRRQDQGNSP